MVDIVGRMGWSYISIIYEESNYGIKVRRLFFLLYIVEDEINLFCLKGI